MANLVSTHNAAEQLGISRRTLLDRVAQGKITPAHRMPGRTGALLFDAEQIDRLAALEARKPEAVAR